MKKLLTTIILTGLFAGYARATIWRVNNTAGVNADYTTIQAAHDAATAGDTIYIERSNTDYSGFTATKRLVIIGGGYDLSTYYPDTYLSGRQVKVGGTCYFNSGSSGSVLIGVHHSSNSIYISTSDITIYRCTLSGVYINSANGDNVEISQSIVKGLSVYDGVTGLIIHNSYIYGSGGTIIYNYVESIWYNNILAFTGSSSLTLNEQTLYNNINTGTLILNNCNLTNNIDARVGSEVFGTANGNFGDVDPDAVFSPGETGYAYYQLNGTSPALGAGVSGVDCGMYGGDTPFVLSGLPPIPWVTKLFNPGAGSNTQPLEITISVESRD